MAANLSFNNDKQKEALINQLQIGQVIHAQVSQKISTSRYLLAVNEISLTANSEVDLMSKSVWLKLLQKSPVIKLQLIIEESSAKLNNIYEYAFTNKLALPYIPQNLSKFLNTSSIKLDMSDLYDFILWFTSRFSWSEYHDKMIFNLLAKGVNIRDLIIAFDPEKNADISKIRHIHNTINKLSKDYSYKVSEFILNDSHFKKLGLVYEKDSNDAEDNIICITTIEKVHDTLTGSIKTNHFGIIPFKLKRQKDNSEILEITFFFESSLYRNSLKSILLDYTKNNPIKLNLLIKNQPIDHQSKPIVNLSR